MTIMNINIFLKLGLKLGDEIHIIDERGEGWTGIYHGLFIPLKETFNFHNYSNGKNSTIEVKKLQTITIRKRA